MSSQVRFALRAATAAAHQRLDSAMATLDLSKNDDLAQFLRVHSAVLPWLEDKLAEGGAEQLIPGWADGRRTAALRADLAALGEAPAPAIAIAPFASDAALLGGAYVLEGSRLGGRLLAKGVAADAPHAFFAAHGNLRPWTGLIAVLERSISTGEALEQATLAANSVFDAYFQAAVENGLRL